MLNKYFKLYNLLNKITFWLIYIKSLMWINVDILIVFYINITMSVYFISTVAKMDVRVSAF